jgi:hypothetical protein
MKNTFLRVDKTVENYESFGWWLPDLLSDSERPPGISERNGKKTDKYDNGIYLPGSQLTSEEPLTSGSQLDTTDVNKRLPDLESNTTVNKKCTKGGGVINKTKNPMSPTTAARSDIRHLPSKVTLKNKKIFEDSTLSRQQLATLINPTNNKQLQRVLYQTPTELTKFGRQFKTSRPPNKSVGYLSGSRTRLQEMGATSQSDGDPKVLSPFVELALSVEHDTGRELEEPRGQFLEAVSGLDSKLRALQADSMQLHSQLNTLHKDFQVSGTSKKRTNPFLYHGEMNAGSRAILMADPQISIR